LLGPLLSLRDTMANDIELVVHFASPFPLRLFGGLPVFAPPCLDPFRDDLLGIAHHDFLEIG
jgi:hypothetical protein